MADQAMYHQGNQSVFVGGRLWTLLPPPATKNLNLEVLHLYRCVTHTQLVHTHTPSLCVAGMARMTWGWLWWRAWFPFATIQTYKQLSHTHVFHTSLPVPFRLHLSLATFWKKLTCGVIRSFIFSFLSKQQVRNATWSSVSFLEETFDAESCEGDWTRDNAWFALNLCVALSQRSHMFTLTDGVLLFAEWNGLECLGTPNVIEQFSTECSPGTSKAFTMLASSMAEGPWIPFTYPTRAGYLTYSKTPVNMPAWAYAMYYYSSTCSGPPDAVWVSPLGACKKEPYGSYKMFCENGVVVQHYFEGNKDGCNGNEDKCACDPTIPPPSSVASVGFDSLSTSACVEYDGKYYKVFGGCE